MQWNGKFSWHRAAFTAQSVLAAVTHNIEASGLASVTLNVDPTDKSTNNSAFIVNVDGTEITRFNEDRVTIAGGDITLNANGVGEFSSFVLSGPGNANNAEEGSGLFGGSGVVACFSNDVSPLWRGYKVGNLTPTSQIKVDGSARFAGDLDLGDQTYSNAGNGGIYLGSLGAGAGTINSYKSNVYESGGGNDTNSFLRCWSAEDDTSAKIEKIGFRTDGSAIFGQSGKGAFIGPQNAAIKPRTWLLFLMLE